MEQYIVFLGDQNWDLIKRNFSELLNKLDVWRLWPLECPRNLTTFSQKLPIQLVDQSKEDKSVKLVATDQSPIIRIAEIYRLV